MRIEMKEMEFVRKFHDRINQRTSLKIENKVRRRKKGELSIINLKETTAE